MARPLPELVLFLDECLGSTDVPNALANCGATVELLRSNFANGTSDEEWLREVGKRGWVVLTRDKRIRRRAIETKALMDAEVAAFVLSSGNLTGQQTATAFVNAYTRIHKIVRDYKRPFVASVNASGAIKFLTDPERLAAKRK